MQDFVGGQRQQFFTGQTLRKNSNPVVVFIAPYFCFIGHAFFACQVSRAVHGQALNQQASRDVVIGCQHQGGVELFALQHVMRQHIAETVKRLALVVIQRHHALVGLLPWTASQRV